MCNKDKSSSACSSSHCDIHTSPAQVKPSYLWIPLSSLLVFPAIYLCPISLLHVSLDLPLFLVLCGFQSKNFLVMLLASCLNESHTQLQSQVLTSLSTGICLVLLIISSMRASCKALHFGMKLLTQAQVLTLFMYILYSFVPQNIITPPILSIIICMTLALL